MLMRDTGLDDGDTPDGIAQPVIVPVEFVEQIVEMAIFNRAREEDVGLFSARNGRREARICIVVEQHAKKRIWKRLDDWRCRTSPMHWHFGGDRRGGLTQL